MSTNSAYYGRKYNLKITTFGGTDIDVSNLRCTFHTDKKILSTFQSAEIIIYNLAPDTETDIFKNGQYVKLEAGYENGAYGVIFKGFIFQPIRGKEEPTTTFLRLCCMDGDYFLQAGLVNLTFASGVDAATIAKQICRSSTPPFDIDIEAELSKYKLQRGKTVSGNPMDYLRDLALSHNASLYVNHGKAHITSLSKSAPAIVPDLNAKTGLIGMPQQTAEGITFTCLINPTFDLDTFVHINNQEIIQNQVEFEIGRAHV